MPRGKWVRSPMISRPKLILTATVLRAGSYMYDNMHYTPEGCRLVASFMRPVLHRLLELGGRE